MSNAKPREAKIATVAVLCSVLALLAASCSTSSSAATNKSGGSAAKTTLTVAELTPPNNLDPSKAGGAATAVYQSVAYQGLLHLSGSGLTVSPSLAQSFKWIGGTKFQVVLEPGLKFSDGTPLNSAAVKTSVEHFASNGSVFAYEAKEVTSIDTPDSRTVVFNLNYSDPNFPSYLAESSGMGMIISPKAIQANPGALTQSTDGAGPYELSESATIPGSTYTYLPNPNYYNKPAIKYAKIVIRVIANVDTALASLQSGQVQVAPGVANLDARATSSGLSVSIFSQLLDALYIQDPHGTLVPALKNAQVRQAMNQAVNRQAICKAVTLGIGAPTDQLALPGSTGYEPQLTNYYSFNVSKAKQLMAAAGYSHGFAMNVVIQGFTPTDVAIAQAVAEQLAVIGVKVNITAESTFPTYALQQESGTYAGTLVDYPFTGGTPTAITDFFAPNGVGNPRHETVPSLLALASTAQNLSGSAGLSAWQAVNEYIVKQALSLPICNVPSIIYSSKSVHGTSATLNPIFYSPAA